MSRTALGYYASAQVSNHSGSGSAASSAHSANRATVLETKMALRDLWVEHIFWICSYVVATHAGDEAQSKIAGTEVVSNAKALAGTIKPFYGQAAADDLLKLLAGHWGRHAMRKHMLRLSDAIIDGLAAPFPERFQKET